MAFYTPNTAVHLCNVPLTLNSSNQFCPNGWTLSDQSVWFSNHVLHAVNDYTYQRKDNIIRVGINADILRSEGINYCYYSNDHYGSKRFYCYVTLIEFVNENCSHLHIKTDVFQTWLFDMKLNTTFVARQTVLNDDMFKYTLPENLPIGDTKIESIRDITEHSLSAQSAREFGNNYYCVIAMSDNVSTLGAEYVGFNRWGGGAPIGCYIYACNTEDYPNVIKEINKAGKAGSIISCFAVPKHYVQLYPLTGGSNPPVAPKPSLPTGTYLNSPFATNFTVTPNRIWNPPSHYGIDMSSVDDNLYANTGGLVIASLYHNSFGNIVIIKSSSFNTGNIDTFYYFMYCHLDSRSVSTGQTVNVGDNIGVEGDTGASEGVHCHFEVQEHNDIPVLYSASDVGNNFGHDVIHLSQSIDPTTFMDITNTEGYK